MPGRREARFWVKSAAKVISQGNPQSASECILLDISATGIGLVTKKSLPINEMIVLETEQHLVLAIVRHCGPRGDGFSVGAERIHTVSRSVDVSESETIEQRRELIKGFQGGAPAEIRTAGRCETRFGFNFPAKVALQGNPESASECILLDVSATGIGLVTKKSLPVNEIIVLETEQHLVFAKIRHCSPRGNGFDVGAERVRTVNKLANVSESEKIEQRLTLVPAFQSTTPAEVPVAQSAQPALAERSSEVSETLVQSNCESHEVSQRPESVQPSPSVPIEASDAGLKPSQVQLLAEPGHAAEKSQPTVLPDLALQEALELDKTDAEPIPAPPSRSSWRVPLGVAAAVVGGLLVFGLHQNSAKPDQLPPSLPPEKRSPSEPATGSEHVSVSQPIAMDASPTEVQRESLSPASVNDSRSRHAVIKAVELSWLSANCDGKQIFQGMLAANETLAVEFSEEAVLRIGNAGGVEVSLDGKSIGSPGAHGKYRVLKLSPDGKKKEP